MTIRPLLLRRCMLPAENIDGKRQRASILLADGRIKAIDTDDAFETSEKTSETFESLACEGLVALPGALDMRVFTGEPGHEHRETLASAARAAAAGGVTAMLVMPDASPPIDSAATAQFVLRRAEEADAAKAIPAAAATKGLNGERMTEIGLLKEAGAAAITDGNQTIADSALFMRILRYAKDFDMPTLNLPQEPSLAADGAMHGGGESAKRGLRGIPEAAETVMLERDLRLAALTGAPYHAAQISCAESVRLMRQAKDDGVNATCAVSINHLLLTDADVGDYRTFFKLRPPLRAENDRHALIKGVADGVIDAVVSGHDPQGVDTKRLPFEEAAFGAIGLETLLSATFRLVRENAISEARMSDATATAPARILGLPPRELRVGGVADLTLLNPDATWNVTPEALLSLSKNTPFEGETFIGRADVTVVNGRIVHDARKENA